MNSQKTAEYMQTLIPGPNSENNAIIELWDRILSILLERVNKKAIPDSELRHIVGEIKLILLAAKGKTSVWSSVLDVAIVLIEKDASIRDLRLKLSYSESTIYRALNRLEMSGAILALPGASTARNWTLNERTCPVLRRASRLS